MEYDKKFKGNLITAREDLTKSVEIKKNCLFINTFSYFKTLELLDLIVN